jgi:hypothetical protein
MGRNRRFTNFNFMSLGFYRFMSFGVEEYQGINLYSSVRDLPPSLYIKGPYIIG